MSLPYLIGYCLIDMLVNATSVHICLFVVAVDQVVELLSHCYTMMIHVCVYAEKLT